MFGYVLAKKFWGRGMAAEALTYLVDGTLAQPSLYRAYAFCDVEHPTSVRVMEKAGMVREGILRRWHVAPPSRSRAARLPRVRKGALNARST